MDKYSRDLISLIKNYYTDFYKNQLGLKDFASRVESRLNEESIEAARIAGLEELINFPFNKGQKHLIIGTGTGGLAAALFEKGCSVWGIEPSADANKIVQLKAKAIGMPEENFTTHKAENLPFGDNTFDFIHCYSVIEHVDNIKKAFQEIVRVLRPGGTAYINTRDYRYPYESHYKITYPAFLPKIFGYLFLLINGRPLAYFRHIKYITGPKIDRILYYLPVAWMRIYREMPQHYKKSMRPIPALVRFFVFRLNIPDKQEILIRKKERC